MKKAYGSWLSVSRQIVRELQNGKNREAALSKSLSEGFEKFDSAEEKLDRIADYGYGPDNSGNQLFIRRVSPYGVAFVRLDCRLDNLWFNYQFLAIQDDI